MRFAAQTRELLVGQQARQRLGTIVGYALAILVALLFLLPLFWMISSSLKPNYQVLEFPPRWLPDPVTWSNYPEALTYVPFGRYSLNTLFIAVMIIVGHVLSCTVVAYAFARLRAPGKNLLFVVLLATMMLPYPVTMIPIYIGFKTVGWVNTFLPLIVPAFFGSPFYIFLMRQFFLTLPPELEDAARVDGANTLQILWHVILPISRPALATVADLSPFRRPGTTFCRRSSTCTTSPSTRSRWGSASFAAATTCAGPI